MQFLKNYWHFFAIGALVLIAIGLGVSKAPVSQQPVVAQATPVNPAPTVVAPAQAQPTAPAAKPECPPQFESCVPKKSDTEKLASAIDRLGDKLAASNDSAVRALAGVAPAPATTADSRSPFIAAAPAGHHFVGATKGRDGASCEARGGKIVPDTSKPAVKTGKGLARPNKCTADA